jgi:rod shape-determining protein MreD
MRSFLVGLPIMALAAVAQSTILTHYHFYSGTLDLGLLIVLGWSLTGESGGGVVWGFMGGLCLDLLSGGPFGSMTLGLTVVAYLAGLTEGRFWGSHVLLPLAVALLGTAVFHAVNLALLSATGYAVSWGGGLAAVVLPSALVNTLLMLPIYYALRWVHAQVYPRAVTA